MTATETRRSYCRMCMSACPLLVDVEDGVVTHVRGDSLNELYGGYTCVKGRAQPDLLSDPSRLLHSLKRVDGELVPVSVQTAMDEIAERIMAITDRYGPRAVAGYAGTMSGAAETSKPFFNALLKAIGTTLQFEPMTIDQPGKVIVRSLLGEWMAPPQSFDEPDVALFIGTNPLLTYIGLPISNPGKWLGAALDRGMDLIVIDPRRSDVARRATLHLQVEPGHDAHLLAAMIRVILDEGLWDREFVSTHVRGVEELHRRVASYVPSVVAAAAGIETDALVGAARLFAAGKRGYAVAGTGPNMSGPGTLIEYLVITLDTLCGHLPRAGDRIHNASVLAAPFTPKAQAKPPTPWALDERTRIRGLGRTMAGLPTAVLPDEILTPGEGQVRALLSWGGNPVVAFPDQVKTSRALRSLDLLVQVDPWLSATARLAHYVIATKMPLEVASVSTRADRLSSYGTPGYGIQGWGLPESHAQYTPAVVEPPAGAELIEEWQLFCGLAERMGTSLRIDTPAGPRNVTLDQLHDTDDVIDLVTQGSRVPLSRIKEHPEGTTVPEPVIVAGADPGWEGYLDVANADMMADLEQLAVHDPTTDPSDPRYPLRLVCRRHAHVFNSSHNIPATNRGRSYNPAFLHPDDLHDLGLRADASVTIVSAHGNIPAIVQEDANLRRGIVSMMFAYGRADGDPGDVRVVGSSPNRLLPDDEIFDRYSGQPRMSNVPVRIEAGA